MNLELDHVFLATVNARAAEEALTEFGLVFSRHVRHPGQGTANACALFDNAFFEILWPDDDAEINSTAVNPLGLWQRARWRETGACPFGISFRPADSNLAGLPDMWIYDAAYLPPGAGLPIVTPKNAHAEPLVFISPKGKPPIARPSITKDSLQQCGAGRRLTAVRVTRPRDASMLSAGLQWFCEYGLFSISAGDEYRMDLEWDNGVTRKTQEFHSPIPLTFHW